MLRRLALIVLGLAALVNLGRGAVHLFAPDGGAASIAGLELGAQGATIVSLFAVIGATQAALGLFHAAALAFRRDLVAWALGLQTAVAAGGVAVLTLHRPLPVEAPGEAANLALLVLWAAGLACAVASARKA